MKRRIWEGFSIILSKQLKRAAPKPHALIKEELLVVTKCRV